MKVLTLNQLKTAEENAVKNGIYSYCELMKNAGDAATKEILKRYEITAKKVCVICGLGNNGGDGLVVASNLKHNGADVSMLLPFGYPKTDTASVFIKDTAGIKIINDFSEEEDFDIIIDAFFGIGLNRFLSEDISALIERINNYDCVKIAIDIPSGVFCDGGEVLNAFKADLTLTFTSYKLCQLLPQTSEYCGKTVVLDIGIPINDYAYLVVGKPKIHKRPRNSHKGTYGTALLYCGSYGMCGAEILSAKAALRSGVGIVKAIVCDKNYSAFTSAVPEAVTIPVMTAENGSPTVYDKTVLSAVSSSTAMLIGCGLGRSENTVKSVKRALELTNIPTVIDADGINALVGSIDLISKVKAPVILTPHPAEMARLCNTTTDTVESNRIKISKKFAVENKCTLVLKGTNTIIASENGEIYFNTTGNNGLSKGGSGDVLSGMIVSRLAQGYRPLDAALSSVWLHGAVADRLACDISTRAILPTDIIEGLKTITD